MGILVSPFFREDERLQKCAADHRYCVRIGDRGKHVGLLQIFMQAWVNASLTPFLVQRGPEHYYIDPSESTPQAVMALDCVPLLVWQEYNAGLGEMVRLYKDYYSVIDKKRQVKADNIVGVLTIRHMDMNGRNMRGAALDSSNQAYLKASPPTMKTVAALGPRRALRLARRC